MKTKWQRFRANRCYATVGALAIVMSTELPKGIIRFASFEVDPQSGELRKHGLRIKLQDQPFKVLVTLLEKPGEVVGRDLLRERIWGNETFVDFNHGLSAAVNRLRDALGDSVESPRYVETVARRGYRFMAPVEVTPTPVSPMAVGAKPSMRAAAGVLFAVVAAAMILFWMVGGPTNRTPARLVQVTSLTGSETMPTFSPDGAQVAFVWNGEKESNSDIYVKMLGSATALRLTSDPGADLLPSWSPDGRQIAFVRIRGATGIYLVSPLGGPERKLIELPGMDRRPAGPETKIVGDLLYPTVNRPSWSADGKFLVVSRFGEPPEPGDGTVLLVPVEGGEPLPILVPQRGKWYKHPTFSPDGRSLAFASCGGGDGSGNAVGARCQLQIVPLGAELLPRGEARTILADAGQIRGLAWMPDGGSLVVSGFSLPHYYAWRVSASKAAEPERIEMAGVDAIWPAISGVGGRLSVARSILQADVWKFERGGKPVPFLSSTVRENFPQFSPDGKRIAFQSARGGANDIWVAQANGTGLVQITRDLSETNEAPRWSPSGKWVAFGSIGKQKRSDVWMVEADGGPARQLTNGPGNNSNPSWSRDGKWIYFASSRSGRSEVWRMPVAGGDAEQITKGGGYAGVESVEGSTLFYTKSDSGTEGIYTLPVGGDDERRLVPDTVLRRGFAVVRDGIYYLTPRDEGLCEIRFHEFASGHHRAIGEIERPVAFGLTVSPDEKTFLFSKPVTGSDLWLIENFR